MRKKKEGVLNWKSGCLLCVILVVIGFVYLIVTDEMEDANAEEWCAQCDVACEQNDFEKAHELLIKIKDSRKSYNYDEKKKMVYDKEIHYLISMNSEEASDRLAYLLTEFLEVEPKPIPEGASYANYNIELDEYNSSVSKANEYVNKLYLLAASQNNKYLCKKLLFFFREEAVRDEMQFGVVSYINSAKESAITKYKEFFSENPDI